MHGCQLSDRAYLTALATSLPCACLLAFDFGPPLSTVFVQGEDPQLPGFPTEELKPLTVRMVAGVIRDIALQTTRCPVGSGLAG